jgi:hypothetical protein
MSRAAWLGLFTAGLVASILHWRKNLVPEANGCRRASVLVCVLS